jgi:acyl carrier protein
MQKLELLNEIESIVEVDQDSLTLDTQLDTIIAWDSMAVISFISMIDEKLNLTLDVSKIALCKTISDLVHLCEEKLEG